MHAVSPQHTCGGAARRVRLHTSMSTRKLYVHLTAIAIAAANITLIAAATTAAIICNHEANDVNNDAGNQSVCYWKYKRL